MSEDSPKIVSLETSFELAEFPSEAEFTSEAEAPPVIPTPALAAPITPAARPRMSSNVVPLSTPEPRVEPEAPRPSAPVAAPASVTSITAGIGREPVSAPETVIDPVRQPAHSGPAVVTEFPVKPQTPAAVAVPTLPGPCRSSSSSSAATASTGARRSRSSSRSACIYETMRPSRRSSSTRAPSKSLTEERCGCCQGRRAVTH